MVNKILTLAGFVEHETFEETRFLQPPKQTYAVYNDSYSRRGADNLNMIKEHDYTIELYSYKKDSESEKRIEKVLDDLNIEFEKQERYWIQSEQIYQVIYDFNYIEK